MNFYWGNIKVDEEETVIYTEYESGGFGVKH